MVPGPLGGPLEGPVGGQLGEPIGGPLGEPTGWPSVRIRGASDAMTALAKLDWKEVPKTPKKDLAARLACGFFNFTLYGFQEKDARYDADAVTIRLRWPNGALVCDEARCPAPDFGLKKTTRSEYSTFKHLQAYCAPGRVTFASRGNGLPYWGAENKALCMVDGDDDGTLQKAASSRRASDRAKRSRR